MRLQILERQPDPNFHSFQYPINPAKWLISSEAISIHEFAALTLPHLGEEIQSKPVGFDDRREWPPVLKILPR